MEFISGFEIPRVKYVETQQENGCVIACVAMITGQTFKQTLVGFEEFWNNEGKLEGTGDEPFFQYLSARGYAMQHVSHDYRPEDKLIEPWPLKPWAPIHTLDVYSEGPHAVVMLHDGTILDPNDRHIKSIDEYHRVYAMQGIWKIGLGKLFNVKQ